MEREVKAMSGSITKASDCLKAIIKGFYVNGSVTLDGSLKGFTEEPSEDQRRICAKIAHLVMDNNGFFKDDTKYWLSGSEDFSDRADNKHTKRSRINYDVNIKFSKLLGSNALNEICNGIEDFTKYERPIDDLLKKYQSRSVFDKLVFKVRHEGIKAKKVVLDDEDIVKIAEIFTTYNKERIHSVGGQLTPEIIGYIKYLEKNGDKLEGTDKEMWELVTNPNG